MLFILLELKYQWISVFCFSISLDEANAKSRFSCASNDLTGFTGVERTTRVQNSMRLVELFELI